ncbi:hypothetical protein Cgig2_023254 [Carnegiea gigantea]|uniref:Uncharacterized protein n=1 Tax=Carnegiea gigantea TaxID=171969 RepID=A0A9Q1GZF9_9CARY|nr:hypothetical protein Cgig2_023254 [Carnegiea gigantea]
MERVPGEQCRRKVWRRGSCKTQAIHNWEAQGKVGRVQWKDVDYGTVYTAASVMELCRRRRGMRTEATHVSSSSSDSDDDISEYEAKDEGKDNAKSSSLVMGEDELGCAMPELRSKKRHDKGYVRDVSVSGKPAGKVSRKRGTVTCSMQRSVGRPWLCGDKASVRVRSEVGRGGNRMEACVEVQAIWNGRHLVQALVESWNAEMKAFKVGSREILFTVYSVALLTGLPATRKLMTFDRGIGASEVEEVIKEAIEDHLAKERNRRRSARSDVRLYRNYVAGIVELCKQNNTAEHGRVQLIGGHLELPGGSNKGDKGEAAFEEELADGWLCDDTSGTSLYYVNVLLRCYGRVMVNLYIGRSDDATVLISSVKDNQVKCIVSLFVMVLSLKVRDVERGEPTVQAFCGNDEFQAYMDDTQGILSLEERLRRVREALRLEKEAHAATKKKLEYMTELLMARGEAAEVEKGLLLSSTREGNGDGPDIGGTPDECGDRSDVGGVVGKAPTGEYVGSDVHNGQEGMEGSCSSMQQGGKRNISTIANKIRRRPRRHNPSVMQTSPYVNPEAAVGVGKRKGGIKRAKKARTHASEEPKAQQVMSCNSDRETTSPGTDAVVPVGADANALEPLLVNAQTQVMVACKCTCT